MANVDSTLVRVAMETASKSSEERWRECEDREATMWSDICALTGESGLAAVRVSLCSALPRYVRAFILMRGYLSFVKVDICIM